MQQQQHSRDTDELVGKLLLKRRCLVHMLELGSGMTLGTVMSQLSFSEGVGKLQN